MVKRILGLLSYDGSYFNGFQTQLSKDSVQDEVERVLSKIFNEDFYQVIPYLRFILNKKIEYNDKENILKQCDSIKKDFLKDDLIGINISRFFNDKNYDLLKQTLIVKNGISGVNILLPNYIKYTTFINIFEYKDKDNKTVLDYTKEDEKFKEFIREFLIKTIWINFLNIVNIDPINKYNIVRTKQAIEILFDKNNNFREYKIDFKKYLDEFFKKSKILTSLKLTQELHDKISDNKIICIRWADKDFYRDGKVLLNFNDYLISWDEKNEYNIDAQERIKSLLKAPSTAKFPNINNWKFGKDNGIVTVQAYVDSENSFGAKLRSEFQIKYDSNKNVISLIIDGVEYIK